VKNVVILILLIALFALTNPTRTEVTTGQAAPVMTNEVPPDFWASLALSGVGALVDVLAGRSAQLGDRWTYWNLGLLSYGAIDGGRAGAIRCIFALRSGLCRHMAAG
jgi:hypothetical protein